MEKIILVNQADGLTGRISSILEAYAVSCISSTELRFTWPGIEINSNNKFYSIPDKIELLFASEFFQNRLTNQFLWEKDNYSNYKIFLYKKYGDHYQSKNKQLHDKINDLIYNDFFSREIINLFNEINKSIVSFGEFDAVHFRCGDVFYGDYTDNESFISNRTLDYTQVMHICENVSKANRIFLFGATKQDIDYIAGTTGKIFTINSLLQNAENINGSVFVILDAFVASKAKKLFCSNNSHVTRLASILNPSLNLIKFYITDAEYLRFLAVSSG